MTDKIKLTGQVKINGATIPVNNVTIPIPAKGITGTATPDVILSDEEIMRRKKENTPITYDPELTECYDEIAETFHHLGDLFTKLSTLER